MSAGCFLFALFFNFTDIPIAFTNGARLINEGFYIQLPRCCFIKALSVFIPLYFLLQGLKTLLLKFQFWNMRLGTAYVGEINNPVSALWIRPFGFRPSGTTIIFDIYYDAAMPEEVQLLAFFSNRHRQSVPFKLTFPNIFHAKTLKTAFSFAEFLKQEL